MPKSINRRLVNIELDKILPTLKGNLILDMGGKQRRLTSYFKDKTYVSIDLKPGIKDPLMIQGDGHHLPFQENTFDIVISTAVIEHTKFPWIIFEEFSRVLKKEGKLVLSWPWLYVYTHDDYWRLHIQAVKWLAEKNNLKLDYYIEIGGMLTNLAMQLMYIVEAKVKIKSLRNFFDSILYKMATKDKKYNTRKHTSSFIAVLTK